MGRMLAGLAFTIVAAAATGPAFEGDGARLAQWHYDQGVELMKAESWEEAAEQFAAAIANDNLLVVAHYNLGQCRMAQKRYVEAGAAYRASRETFERLSSLSQQDRDARERARRDEIDDLKDSLTRLHTMKGVNVEQMTMRLQERIRLLESMQYRDVRHMTVPAEIPLALGSAYFRQERLGDAEREYTEAVRLNGKLGAAHNNLAVIYMLTGRLAESRAAVAAAEKAGFAVNPRFKADLGAREAAAKK